MKKVKSVGEFKNLFEAFKHLEGQEERALTVTVDFTREDFKGHLNGDPAPLLLEQLTNTLRHKEATEDVIILPGHFRFIVYEWKHKMRAVGYLQVNILQMEPECGEDDDDLELAS